MASHRAPLLPTDRCDKCGSQAYVRAVLRSRRELLFCGHHAHEFSAALIERGAILRGSTPEAVKA